MNIPRCAVRELNKKNRESQEQSQLPVQVLTHLLLPLLSFLLPFPKFTILVLSIGHPCPCCHQGEKMPRIHFINIYVSGVYRHSSNLPSLCCQVSGNTYFSRLIHISKASLIMHFQEAPRFTNMEDTHMLYLNK